MIKIKSEIECGHMGKHCNIVHTIALHRNVATIVVYLYLSFYLVRADDGVDDDSVW